MPGQFTSTLATGTAPFSITSTTVVPNLNVSQLLGNTWVAPGTIGSTTPNTGAFTTITATTSVSTGTAPAVCGTATGCFGATEGTSSSYSATSGQDAILADSTAHEFYVTLNGGTKFVSAMNLQAPSSPVSGDPVTQTIASGTATLGTSSISSASCATVVTVSATGAASTDAIEWTPNASIKAVTGFAPSTSGGLSIAAYPTSGDVNFDVCNWSSGSITPGAVTLNWRVVR
jgi:hypothetical protein